MWKAFCFHCGSCTRTAKDLSLITCTVKAFHWRTYLWSLLSLFTGWQLEICCLWPWCLKSIGSYNKRTDKDLPLITSLDNDESLCNKRIAEPWSLLSMSAREQLKICLSQRWKAFHWFLHKRKDKDLSLITSVDLCLDRWFLHKRTDKDFLSRKYCYQQRECHFTVLLGIPSFILYPCLIKSCWTRGSPFFAEVD